MSEFENYQGYIQEQAESFVDEYKGDIIAEIKGGDTDVYSMLNDSRIYEWVDNDFIYVGLVDSAHIIEQSDNVETDSGFWEGQEPMEAIKTQAFFTYRNDLYMAVKDTLEEELQGVLGGLEEDLQNLQAELDNIGDDEENKDDRDELEEQISELEDEISNFELALGNM